MTTLRRLALAMLLLLPLAAAAQMPEMSGTVGYSIDGNSVVLNVERIDYACPAGVSGRSGTLRLTFWASASPYQGLAQPGYLLATYTIGELNCNQYYLGLSSGTIAFTRPPDGTWYMTLMLEEFDGDYYVADYLAFSRTETFGSAPPVVLTAVEFFHQGFGHYFVTAIANEIADIDAGRRPGWTRTGYTFRVYPLGTAGAANVCRFFSTAFGLRSSHFYTATECAVVQRNPDWSLEGEVFAVVVPSLAGVCPAGTIPLYRLYNNAPFGAPNHRYTTSLTVRSQMIAEGWSSEGWGPLGVISCVPA